MRKPIDITPNEIPIIPAKEKIKNSFLEPSMGQVLGGITLGGGDSTVRGRSLNTIAEAIDADGNFIHELINDKLNTQTTQILGEFTFGESGAIKIATDDDNGLWISPIGILGKKAGATTFAIDTEGDATFAGELAAAYGILGAITIGTNAWHVDGSGNMWWGNYASYADAVIKISAAGAIDFTTGNFAGTLAAAAGTLGVITAGSIYSGLFSTAAAAATTQRIIMSNSTNAINIYDDSNNNVGNLGLSGSPSVFFGIDSPFASPFYPIEIIQRGASLQGSIYINNKDSGAGARGIEIIQEGDKTALRIDHPATSSGNSIEVEHLGNGICGDFYLNNTDALSNALRVRNTGSAYAASIVGRIGALFANTQSAGSYAGYFKQDSKISGSPAHFSRLLQLETDSYSMVIFMSDRTSPDGALTGGIGDICFNCDGGQVYYCQGSTTWVAL